jgi:hypothetical protein
MVNKKNAVSNFYFVFLASTYPKDVYLAAVKELRKTANEHYHTAIGWATGFEIIATVLIFIVTAITFLLGTASRAVDI